MWRQVALAALAVVLISFAGERRAYPAVRYALPGPDRPRGEIKVESYGVRAESAWVGVLHVRLTITNDVDDTPWQIDTGEVTAEIEGQGASQAGSVATDAGTPPLLSVPRGERRVVDLYFAAPTSLAGSPSSCSVTWSVRTGDGAVTEETSFGQR